MTDFITQFGDKAKDHLVTQEMFHLPELDPNSHKGDNGRVLIVAGSSLFHGAAELAAIGMTELLIRITSITNDGVFFSSTKENIDALKKQTPIFIGVQREELDEYIKTCDIILAGPGLMREPQNERIDSNSEPSFTRETTKKILESGKKVVLDAGSLQVISPDDLLSNSQTILTPHRGEMSQLFNIDITALEISHDATFEQVKNVAEKVQVIARKYDTTILLKGPVDIIAGTASWYFSPGGNAGMTKGGTGDLLAGVTTALYNRVHDPILTAALASYLLKRTAEALYEKYKDFYDAYDAAKKVGETFEVLRGELVHIQS